MKNRLVSNGMKQRYKEELEDSLDTSWLSNSIQSPAYMRPKLDLSQILSQQSLNSSRASISMSHSFGDMSFFRSELNTPRIVKASHDVKTLNSSRISSSTSFFRSKPRVVKLKQRTVAENLLLDVLPNRR